MTSLTRRALLGGIGTTATIAGLGGVASGRRSQGQGDGTTADVRVVHAVPDAPPVDVTIDEVTPLAGVPFGAASLYLGLEKGTYGVTVTGEVDGEEATLFDEELALEANTDYTVAATGALDGAADPALVPFVDDNRPAPADAARIRAVHLSPDAPAVDVAVADGDALVEDLEFREASDYLEVPGDDYDLAIRPAGADPGDAVFTFSATLREGVTYSAFALGLLEGEGDQAFGVLPTVDAMSPANDQGDGH